MNRRIETRSISTGLADLTTLIQRNASKVWWISISTKTNNSKSLLTIYDGFDTGGKIKWRHQLFTSDHFNFIPPIPCEQGIAIFSNSNVESYTIGYRPLKWDRPIFPPEDVIEHPEA